MLTIHPATKKTLERLADNLPQPLLLSGEKGVGLFTIASWLAGSNIADEIFPKDTKGQRDDHTGTISVDAVRHLYEQTRTKFTKRQVFIIDNADRMSHGAQNAFLKLLEEPNAHIHFLLTSHYPEKLLPTIRSRVQHTFIQPITAEQSATFIESLNINNPTKKAQLQFIATGFPAELARLSENEESFLKQAEIFGNARDFLQGNAYQKLLIIQKCKGDRSRAIQLLDSTVHILRRSISSHPQQSSISQLDQLLAVRERLSTNQNIALQLARLVV